ncbi:MAG: F0F1 ATP synthase subunit delta [Paracoccaceae bacterium]
MQFDWWTLAIQAINFLVLVWLLSRFLYRPVRQVIEKRQALSAEAADAAQRKADEAEAARQRYEDRQRELEAERRALAEKVHKDMQQEREKLLQAARDEAEQIRADAKAATEKERNAALSALKSEIANLAAAITRQVLQASGTTGTGRETLAAVRSYFDGLSEDELEALQRDVAGESTAIELVTATELSAAERKSWRNGLHGSLQSEAHVAFVVDPEILGGVELRFPHSILSFTWAHRIEEATARMIGESDEH